MITITTNRSVLGSGGDFIGLVSVASINGSVDIVNAPTLYAITNAQSGNVTLNPSPNFIGLATVVVANSVGNAGNVTLNPSPNFIGLSTVVHGSNVTLNSSNAWIGLATVNVGNTVPVSFSNVTLSSNVTLNPSSNFIGLVSTASIHGKVDIVSSPTLFAVVNTGAVGVQNSLVTLLDSDAHIGSVSIYGDLSTSLSGNVTLNPSPNFIGLATVVQANQPALVASSEFIGLVSTASIHAKAELVASSTFIGLATVVQANQPALVASSAFIGMVSVASIHGKVDIISAPTIYAIVDEGTIQIDSNVTLNPSSAFIGLVSTASIHGKVDIVSSPTLFAVVNTGVASVQNSLVTLLNSNNWIGLISTASIHAKAELVNSTANIGFATINVANTVPVSFGNVTLSSNVTLNPSSSFIGLATVVVGNQPNVSIIGNLTLSSNVTLNPSNAFIGLATVVIGNEPISIDDNNSSLTVDWTSGATVAVSNLPNITLNSSSNFLGLISVASIHGKVDIVNAPTLYAVTNSQTGNVTLNPSPNFIGLVSTASIHAKAELVAGSAFIGLATVVLSGVSINNSQLNVVTSNKATTALLDGLSDACFIDCEDMNLVSFWVEDDSLDANLTINGWDEHGNFTKLSFYTRYGKIYAGNTSYAVSSLVGGIFFIPCGGVKRVQILVSTYVSGQANVFMAAYSGHQFPFPLNGDTPHGDVDPNSAVSFPLKIGGLARATTPSAVDDSDRVNAWFDTTGHLRIKASDPSNFIGLVSTASIHAKAELVSSSAFIGLATVVQSNQPALVASSAFIGLATVVNANQPALVASSSFIGLVSVASIHGKVDIVSSPTLYAVVNTGAAGIQNSLATLLNSNNWVGLATVVVGNTITVSGDIASGSADSGNPVKVGGVFESTMPTYTDGQRTRWQSDSRGQQRVVLGLLNSTTPMQTFADNADDVAVSATARNLSVVNRNTVFDGTVWDRMRGDATDGVLVNLGSNNDVIIQSGATVTVSNSLTLSSNITLNPSSNFIGLVSTASVHGKVDHALIGIGHGVKTVTTAGTDVVLSNATPCRKVVIQSQTDNTGLIAIGAPGVDATIATGTGVVLTAGDFFVFQIDDLSRVYIDSTVSGDGVRFTYFY